MTGCKAEINSWQRRITMGSYSRKQGKLEAAGAVDQDGRGYRTSLAYT